MTAPNVVFYEAFQEEEKAIRAFLPANVCAQFTSKTIRESGAAEPGARLISIRTQSRVPPGWAKILNGVLTRSRGYDHLKVFFKGAGAQVACGYLEDYCARAVAEQAALMMLALLRKFTQQIAQFEVFARDGITGRECRGRNALVVGVGAIGREIVGIARGLGMSAKGVDMITSFKGLEYVTLKEGLKWAGVIFCALPLNRQTENLLNYETLKAVRPGTVLINVGRGEISPVEDLKRLLEEGTIGAIGLDVFPDEPALAECLREGRRAETSAGKTVAELAKNERVVFTPHNAFNTFEALKQKASLSAGAIVSFLGSGAFPCPVPSA